MRLAILVLMLLAQATSADKPREYDLGSCSGHDFTVQHVTYMGGKVLSFDYFMPSADQVVGVEPPIDFKVLSSESSAETGDELLRSEAPLSSGQGSLTYNAIIRGKYQVGVVLNSEGKLSHLLYGAEGTKDDMPKLAEGYYKTCRDFRSADVDELPTKLHEWLEGRQPAQNKKEKR